MALLDDIQKELDGMSDEDIAKAAQDIQARREKAKSSVTPERKAKMKEREAHRRKLQSAILAKAKEKGLVQEVKDEQAAAKA